eukprot:scaffold622_cov335-Pavlova_lutheri.AAC.19
MEARQGQPRSVGKDHGTGGKILPPWVPVDESKTEQGFVLNIRETFGFIKCADRSGTMFFHISELLDSEGEHVNCGLDETLFDFVAVGAEVEFKVQENPARSGQNCAARVKPLPKGTVKMEEISTERFKGTVERELRGAGFMKQLSQAYGGRIAYNPLGAQDGTATEHIDFEGADLSSDSSYSPAVGDEVEFNIKVRRKDSLKQACNISILNRCDRKNHPSRVDNLEFQKKDGERLKGLVSFLEGDHGFIRATDEGASIFFNFSEVQGDAEAIGINTCVEFTVSFDPKVKRRCARNVSVLPVGSIRGKAMDQERSRGCVQKTSSLEFTTNSYIDGTISILGGEGQKEHIPYSAKDVNDRQVILSVGDEVEFTVEKDEDRTLKRAINIVRTRAAEVELHVGNIGVLKPKFGFIKCANTNEDLFFHFSNLQGMDSKDLTVGMTVEFNITVDPRSNRPVASHVKKAAEGVSAFVIQTEEMLSGTCIEPLKYSKGQSKENGVAFGIIEYVDPKTGESRQVPFSHGDLVDVRLNPRLDEVVLFHLAKARYGDGKERAAEITLLPVAAKVQTLKDGFGFLRLLPEEEDSKKNFFFHFSEVQDGVQLNVGDEVECVLVMNPRNEELNARKVIRTKVALDVPRRPREIKFAGKGFGNLAVRLAKGPDGTKGFSIGRGKAVPSVQED